MHTLYISVTVLANCVIFVSRECMRVVVETHALMRCVRDDNRRMYYAITTTPYNVCTHARAREREWLCLCAKRTRNFSIVQCSAWNTGDVVFKQLFQHIHQSHCVLTVRLCSSFAKTRFIGIIALLRYMPKLKIINTYYLPNNN